MSGQRYLKTHANSMLAPMLLLLVAAWLALSSTPAVADEKQAPRRPATFGIIFNFGYAGDHFPRDKENFEKAIVRIKAAHYNVVLCKYEPWRAEICQKHGVKILVDLLVAEHHVYKNVEQVKALCEKLRGSDAVWAYHLWSDRFDSVAAGRNRDTKNVQTWDATHPTYVGGYRMRGNRALTRPDLHGYYDFHWVRGGHWRHLVRARDVSRATDSYFLRYVQGDAGRVGAGNYNRVLYTIATSIAFGLKGYTFHYRRGTIDRKFWQWSALGKDHARVNAEIAPLGPELLRIGNPTSVFSTPTTKSEKDRDKGPNDPPVPAPFEAIPADHWVQVGSGEVILSEFADPEKRPVLFLANHNAYQPQDVQLTFQADSAKTVELFDRKKAQWQPLKLAGGAVKFQVPAAAGELVRVTK